jgi:hypothetical protein
LGGFFEKNCSPSMPPGKRCSDTGRSPFAAINADPTSTMYFAKSSLVMPGSGQSTRLGLEMRTSRVPEGPSTGRTTASVAMRPT